ncbi:MarR family transcriptional regulator, partial [Streptomyces sp. SID11233]|nr:MarR family transcriptional regulator [Streptomyces sp. SID11233]
MATPDFGPTGSLDLMRWIVWALRKGGEDWMREREL